MSRGSNALTTETNINHVIFGERTILSILIKRHAIRDVNNKQKDQAAQSTKRHFHISLITQHDR